MCADTFKFIQAQPFALAGGGAVAGATSVILKALTQIDGTLITMTDFGDIGFGTLEPGNGTLEEQISFTGVTQNANGTATLTGVSSVGMVSPYTATAGLAQTHAGSTTFIISNTAGFYDRLSAKADDETITGLWQFPNGANTPILGSSYVAPTLNNQVASKGYADSLTFAGAPDATTTQKGLVQVATQAQVDAGTATGSTAASLAPTPALLRSRLLSDYVADTGVADAYAIAPSPAITAYAAGQIFSFKALHANTTTSTLAVSGLASPKTIKKSSGANLAAGDILAGQIVMVEYDGTNFQIISNTAVDTANLATQAGVQASTYVYAATASGNDSYAITVSPAIAAYATGQRFLFKTDVANTGTATLAVSGLSAITIVKRGSVTLTTNDILAGQIIDVTYDGTNFQMQTPVSNGMNYTSGAATRAGDATSSSQTIAHGQGVAPTLVNIVANKKIGSNAIAQSIGVFTGSGTTNQWNVHVGATEDASADSTNVLTIHDDVSSAAVQVATISVDATNITLAFTKSGSPTSATINIMWSTAARQ